ncbi:hypothetical protein DM02DRAFT_651521 [Periconia macrospinosa]|uniref:FAD linked oxidase N-terminal domain-containing protein n=1 Tax=Periconia macrospinosa TaxID=97972 RepID=A0A2V1E217_9PLEO|nr:hypothetical protein DM02DRAFT_651521 [Periconia macrospinosa]
MSKFKSALAAFPLFIVSNAQRDESSHSGLARGEHAACASLESQSANIMFFAKSSKYTDQTSRLELTKSPNITNNAEQVAAVVRIMSLTQSLFAVRSGGHMPIPGYNEINADGILI